MADPMTHPLTNALAMRTAALKVIDPGTGDFDMGLWFAVKSLPLEADHAALVAEAVRLPEIAAMIADMEEILRISDRNHPTWSRAWAIIRELKPFLALETP